MLSQDVCPSVRHTQVLCRNGLTYHPVFSSSMPRHSRFSTKYSVTAELLVLGVMREKKMVQF